MHRVCLLLISAMVVGCSVPPSIPLPIPAQQIQMTFGSRMVDLLFVIDNSNSPVDQRTIGYGLRGLLESLRSPLFGGHTGCSASTIDRCYMPHLQIGVISSDLGAGDYGLPSCEKAGGDNGQLQAAPRRYDCTPPAKHPWIQYLEGMTNIPKGNKDPLMRVQEAFQCIVEIGIGGCGFEHHLEAARRALDPQLNINPGFLRQGSLLVVSIFSDEDDCSAARPELFDPSQKEPTDPLGRLTSFRCTEFGLTCDEPLRQGGLKHNCRPSGDWLVKVEDYVRFFNDLRPGRSLFFALTAPAEPFEVIDRDQDFQLKRTCHSAIGNGIPALRLKAVADGFGARGLHNPDDIDCCTPNFEPAFRRLGELILRAIGVQCLSRPLLTVDGEVACAARDRLADGSVCERSTLHEADCVVKKTFVVERPTPLQRCPEVHFHPNITSCAGASCPCWRIVHAPEICDGESPYAIQVLWPGGTVAPSGSEAMATCSVK